MRVLGKKNSKSSSKSNSSSNTTTTTTTSSIRNGVDHGSGLTRNATRIRTILVWCVYGVIQCGLIRLYHHQWTLHKERNDQMLRQQHQRERVRVRALSKTKANDKDNDKDKDNSNDIQRRSQKQKQIREETMADSASSASAGDAAKDTGKDSHADPPEEPPSDEKRQRPVPDGTFNGFPIYELKRKEAADASTDANAGTDANSNANTNANVAQSPLYSQFRCSGETWKSPVFHRRNRKWYEQSWMYRSCLFEMLCFDTEENEYVLYLDPEKHPQRVHGYGSGNDNGNGNDNDNGNDNGNDNDNKGNSAGTNDHNNHPSESIRQILRKQRQQHDKNKKDSGSDNDGDNDNDNDAASEFRDTWKHPSHWDDTSTVYRNHTTIVDATGDVVIGDVANAAQYGVAIGSLNGKWGIPDLQRLKWFPTVRWGAVPGTDGESTESTSNAADESESSHDVYTLPSSVVLLPFHSLSAANPGHLVWDDFLPAYTLLDMFHLNHNNDENQNENQNQKAYELLPIRYILPPNGNDGDPRGLWAGCDWLVDRYRACHSMLQKFGTLLGTRSSYLKYHTEEEDLAEQRRLWEEEEAKRKTNGKIFNNKDEDDDDVPKGVSKFVSASKLPRIPITTNLNVQLKLNDPSKEPSPDPEPYPARDTDHYQISKARKKKRRNRKRKHKEPIDKPKLVCARHGVAGFGAISDHGDGTRSHGWEANDYKVNHNQGRGGQLWDFRNFLVGNVFGDDNGNGDSRQNYNTNNKNNNNNNYYYYKTTHSPLPPITGPKPRPKIPGQPAYLTTDSVVMGMERLAEAERVANQHHQNDSTGNGDASSSSSSSSSSSHTHLAYRAPASITDWAPDEPLVVLFSALSSRTRGRDMFSESNDLRDLIAKRGGPGRAVLGSAYDPSVPSHANLQIAIETHRFSEYTLEEQIHSTSRTAVLVTFCGGGAFSSLFLPKGASLMIYYNEKGGVQNNKNTMLPARLDWDFFNNLGYLHVNWIPSQNSRFVATTVAKTKDNNNDNSDSDSEFKYETNMEANADLILAHLRRIFNEREAAAAKRRGSTSQE